MTKNYQDEQDFIYNGPLSCRIAWSFGEEKYPVLSNIIDVDPLFYIETSYEDELDDFITLEDMTADFVDRSDNMRHFEMLRQKMDRLDRANRHLDKYTKSDIEESFMANKASLLDDDGEVLKIDDLLKDLSQSRLAASFIEFLTDKGLEFSVSNQIAASFYDRELNKIFIREKGEKTKVMLDLIKRVRQAWHHKKGLLIHPLHFLPEDAVLVNRLFEADAQSMMMRVAWELNLAGSKDCWTAIMGGNAHDLACAFAREAISDFRDIACGTANRAVFESWFLSSRCKVIDRELIQQMLSDQHGLVFENVEISKSVTYEVIASIGEMPFGKNYLSSLTAQIADDPLYTDVRDRSNANFLWFIKFERSFRESEQDLQTQSGHQNGRGSSAVDHRSSKEQEDASKVLSFRPEKVRDRTSGSGSDVATIYYLDHFIEQTRYLS